MKHIPTSSNTLNGHQTRWPNAKMLVHPTSLIVQHLSFGRAFRSEPSYQKTQMTKLLYLNSANGAKRSETIGNRPCMFGIKVVSLKNKEVEHIDRF